MKKIISSVILAATLLLASATASASLITASSWDDNNDLVFGSTMRMSNGISVWDIDDLLIDMEAPGAISGQTGDFTQLFSSIAHYAQDINDTLSVTGGSFSVNDIWAISYASYDAMPVSFLGNYVVDLFNDTDFQASGQGILTYGTNSSIMNFNISAYITEATEDTPTYATMGTIFTVIDPSASSVGSGSTAVPEPSTLALFGLAAFGLVSRKLSVNKTV